MTYVCILDSILGETSHIIIDTEKGPTGKSKVIPDGMWVLGDLTAEFSIDALATLSKMHVRTQPDKKFVDAFHVLAPNKSIRWQHAVPKHVFSNFIDDMRKDVKVLLENGCVRYYDEIYRQSHRFLDGLYIAAVDAKALATAIATEHNPTNKSALNSLSPDSSGFTKKVQYDMLATATGRLTVRSGPRILTLPKRYKSIFKSKFDGGKIITIDYNALEPSVAIALTGQELQDDTYTYISKTLLNGAISRKQAKAVTISLLYGASEQTIGSVSGLKNAELRAAIDSVTSYIDVKTLKNKLLKQAESMQGVITNHYGRPIVVDDISKVINYFCQSTAVDVALLGFSNVMKLIKASGWIIEPLFVIHDALMLDVHPDYVNYIDQLIKACEKVEGFSSRFHVKCEDLCLMTAN